MHADAEEMGMSPGSLGTKVKNILNGDNNLGGNRDKM